MNSYTTVQHFQTFFRIHKNEKHKGLIRYIIQATTTQKWLLFLP